MNCIKKTIKQKVLCISLIGRLLPMLAVATVRGASASATATSSITLRAVAILFGALEQDSDLTFDFYSLASEVLL